MNLQLMFQYEELDEQFTNQLEELTQEIALAAGRILKAEGLINVILCSDGFIQELNRDYRNKDYVTDVLSFPLGDEELTGEVYICWQRLLEQAEDLGHSWQREFGFLLSHGLLHIHGYDHGDEPCPNMREMEEKILDFVQLGR